MKTHDVDAAPLTASKQLAQFLRSRRNRLTPAEVGITSSRSRRTPGLRREEVAFLADIGVKWYTRLEMGEEVHPSAKTLLGISHALRLSRADTEYLFELAGLALPRESADLHLDVPDALTRLVHSANDAVAMVTDLILTPLRWNTIADAIFSCSSFSSAIERNFIVRTFSTDPFIRDYTGEDYEQSLRDAVGLFRRHYVAREQDPFTSQVYERLRTSPVFHELWETCTVTDWLNRDGPIIRHHPTSGTLTLLPIDLQIPYRTDLVLKLWFPEGEETRHKLATLSRVGRPSN